MAHIIQHHFIAETFLYVFKFDHSLKHEVKLHRIIVQV
jgi:hypothetical protein